jgi:hypothetical protein
LFLVYSPPLTRKSFRPSKRDAVCPSFYSDADDRTCAMIAVTSREPNVR